MHEHAVLQRGLEQREGLVLVERERRRRAAAPRCVGARRSVPGAASASRPAATRWMPAKIVRSPVVNCSCSSSVATFGRDAARDEAGFQDRLRLGGEEDAARDVRRSRAA